MKKDIQKYCHYCGHELVEVIQYATPPARGPHYYDTKTGKPVVTNLLQCHNPKCVYGCETLGHQWGKAWRFENWEKCQRCGYEIESYY